MKNIRHEMAVWGQVIVLVATWAAVLYVTNTPLQINIEALKKLPDVVVVYGILYVLFTRWGWRIPMLQGWLVPFPNLNGTWEGTLRSTWKKPEGSETPPIPVVLVIRQQFDRINCVIYTQESMSWSTAATLYMDGDDGIKTLSYTYINQPKAAVRDRSSISNGAASLRIADGQDRRLEGEYWTDRKTTGDIEVRFKSTRLKQSFE